MTTPLFSRNLRLALGSFEIARHRLSSKNSPKIHRDQERKRRKKRRVSRPWFGKSVPPLTTGHSAKSCQRVINSRISAGIELLRSSVFPPAFNHAVSRAFYLSPSEKQSRNHHCATHTHTHTSSCKTARLFSAADKEREATIISSPERDHNSLTENLTPLRLALLAKQISQISYVWYVYVTKRNETTRRDSSEFRRDSNGTMREIYEEMKTDSERGFTDFPASGNERDELFPVFSVGERDGTERLSAGRPRSAGWHPR